MARRNRLLEPVAASFAPNGVGGFRAWSVEAEGRAKNQQRQDVKASVKRQERFRMEPVSHNQRSGA